MPSSKEIAVIAVHVKVDEFASTDNVVCRLIQLLFGVHHKQNMGKARKQNDWHFGSPVSLLNEHNVVRCSTAAFSWKEERRATERTQEVATVFRLLAPLDEEMFELLNLFHIHPRFWVTCDVRCRLHVPKKTNLNRSSSERC